MRDSREYLHNRDDVFKIYGVDINHRRGKELVTGHHILSRCEGGSHEKSNIYPMTTSEQKFFHKWQDDRDHGLIEPMPPELRHVGEFNRTINRRGVDSFSGYNNIPRRRR